MANLSRRSVNGGSGAGLAGRTGMNGANISYTQLPASDPPESSRGVRFESSSSPALDDEMFTMFPENIGESFLGWIADLFYGALAFQCSLGVMTIVVFLYLIVRPFSVPVYRRLANQLGMGSYLEAIALLLPNTKICLTGDSDVPSPVGTSILVSNHVVDADWYSLLMLGRCVGLRGSIKVFLRNEILHLNKQTNPHKPQRVRRRNSPPSPPRDGNGGSVNGTSSSSTTIMQESSSSLVGTWTGQTALLAHNNIAHHGTSNTAVRDHNPTSPDVALMAKFLHSFLEFPLIDEEDYVSDRESLFQLLRSFADRNGATAPVHFLLFPEGWSLYNGENRRAVLARSNEFAKREGRPQLKHLLLPRTTGFNASISSLRESSPVIYDATIAYRGYDGSVPQKVDLSIFSLWGILRRRCPEEIHIRIKRYSMEEVLQDASWLDKKWAEKDRMLDHFSRHSCFPVDSRGFCRHQVFETRFQSVEISIVSLFRLILLPCAVPVLLFLSIPILWTTFMAWLLYKGYQYAFPDPDAPTSASTTSDGVGTGQTPGSASQAGTPFIPATPFASPSISNWRDMLLNNSTE
mmetsp:Transcript_11191/g.19728  ORF Transcript_11191/g.19728 Transcript_11191/m.19728 type:complete len:577 (-) Transcript_11191:153-1883(-)|eukprot:CAMPEP_0178746002 /NCGR_PEP_ID=MMETSP0744-20121128/7587_1 /TAXON_ID=913974 /ORGANISM="Nitzschia punctata, Strain CCMP561" /LENGTH=576 /DNA_ID=CAMNT_0020399205 /DNA_START=248 /DNA_END=1978 /DNA_ORIENTATION=+